MTMLGSWKAMVLYPPSWVAMAAVVLAVGALLILLEPSPALSVLVIAVGIVALIAWPVLLAATGTLEEISAPSRETSEVSQAEIGALAVRLDGLDDKRPSDQLHQVRKHYDRIDFLLDRRRSAGDLVYERYRPDVERVYLGVVARLGRASPNGSTNATGVADDPLNRNDVAIAAMERAARELENVQVGQSTRDATNALDDVRALAEGSGDG